MSARIPQKAYCHLYKHLGDPKDQHSLEATSKDAAHGFQYAVTQKTYVKLAVARFASVASVRKSLRAEGKEEGDLPLVPWGELPFPKPFQWAPVAVSEGFRFRRHDPTPRYESLPVLVVLSYDLWVAALPDETDPPPKLCGPSGLDISLWVVGVSGAKNQPPVDRSVVDWFAPPGAVVGFQEQFEVRFWGEMPFIPNNCFVMNETVECVFVENISTLKAIGHAFMWNCASLYRVHISDVEALESIGGAFFGNSATEEITVSNSPRLRSIGHSFMAKCEKLRFLEISRLPALESIGEEIAWGCKNLRKVVMVGLPCLQEIKAGAFNGCGSEDPSLSLRIEVCDFPSLAEIGPGFGIGVRSKHPVVFRNLPSLVRIGPGAFSRGDVFFQADGLRHDLVIEQPAPAELLFLVQVVLADPEPEIVQSSYEPEPEPPEEQSSMDIFDFDE